MTCSQEESAVADFTVKLFQVMGYIHRGRVACTRKDLRLLMRGKYRHAKADVCIFDRDQNDILLLVQADKRAEDRRPIDANAQLVAEALIYKTVIDIDERYVDFDQLIAQRIPNGVLY